MDDITVATVTNQDDHIEVTQKREFDSPRWLCYARCMAKEKEQITVIAQCCVTWNGGSQTVKGFDRAWHLMLDKAEEGLPVSSKFIGFVRKD